MTFEDANPRVLGYTSESLELHKADSSRILQIENSRILGSCDS